MTPCRPFSLVYRPSYRPISRIRRYRYKSCMQLFRTILRPVACQSLLSSLDRGESTQTLEQAHALPPPRYSVHLTRSFSFSRSSPTSP
jgi:hypothetical protein